MNLEFRLTKATRKLQRLLDLGMKEPSPEVFAQIAAARRNRGFLLLATDKVRRPHIYAK